MRNKVLLAAALVALLATPAFAAVQNVKVSGSIDSTYLNRNEFNFGRKVSSPGNSIETTGLIHQSVFITQTTLNISADLSDNVSTTVGLLNERDWGSENAGVTNANASNQNTEVDIYLAYATMREFLYSPLTVSVGRQYFGYGNGLIIGNDGVNNYANGRLGVVAQDLTKRTTYDGVKATLDYKPLTIDLLYFKNNQGSPAGGITNGVSSSKTSSDVYGLNANYQLGDAYNTVVEGYGFARINQKGNVSATADKQDTLYVPGLRVSTNPIKGLNTQAEVAWQLGNKAVTNPAGGTPNGGDNIGRDAMAAQFMANYTLPVYEKYKPTANASYTHVSGDKNARDHRQASGVPNSRDHYSAWDPLNENQGGGTIYNTLFDLSNLNIVALGAQVNPIEDVTASFLWSGLWLDKKLTASNPGNQSTTTGTLIQPDGSTGPVLSTTGRKDLGNEYDVNVNYNYTEDVTLGVSLGWFLPGKTFDGVNNSTASQALAHVNVNF